MQISDVRNAADNGFSVELEHQAQHAVRCGMLWPNVDEHVLTVQIGLDAGRSLKREAASSIISEDRHALRPAL